MKVSLIFSLIVHATLPLMQKIFFASVNLIVCRCDTKNKQTRHCLLLKLSKVTSVVNFIPSKSWRLPHEVSKVVLHIGLNVHKETSGGSRFVTNSSLVCYKWCAKTRSSSTSLVFLVTFTKACPIPIQNNMHSWWIEIKEIPKYKLYDNFGYF